MFDCKKWIGVCKSGVVSRLQNLYPKGWAGGVKIRKICRLQSAYPDNELVLWAHIWYFTLHFGPLSLRRDQSDFLFLYSLINHVINSSRLLEIVTFSINTHMRRNPRLFFTLCHKYLYLKYSGLNRILETENNHRDVDFFGTLSVKIKKHFICKFMIAWIKLKYSFFGICDNCFIFCNIY